MSPRLFDGRRTFMIRWSPYQLTKRRIARMPTISKRPRLSESSQTEIVIAAYLADARR